MVVPSHVPVPIVPSPVILDWFATATNPAFVKAAVEPIVSVPAIVVVEAAPAPIVTSTSPLSSAFPAIVKPAVNVASFSATAT